VHASGPSPTQQQLQKILTERHQWRLRLRAERRHAAAVRARLLATEQALSVRRARLLAAEQQAAAQRAMFISAIEADQARITDVGLRIVATRHEYSRTHQEAAGLLLRLKELKAEIHKQRGNVRAAVVQIYEMSQVSPLETALEAKNLTDLMKQQSYVNQIGSSDYATLQVASREHAAVYGVAKVYIDKMAALRRLQLQEAHQLVEIKAATRHEAALLAKAQKLATHRQAGLQRQEAAVQVLANREQLQLQNITVSARSDRAMIRYDQRAAEQVAIALEQQTGTVPPGVWHGTTPLAEQAAKTAEAYLGRTSTTITPTGYWSGYCEGFAQFVYGEAFQAVSAIAEYQSMLAGGYIRSGIPLRGALVFYGGGQGYGHVAISVGGGMVVSTMGYSGDKMPISENPYRYFPAYLGWAMPF
jgi:cell wall-associated NlpC family hydrolase